jgi:hypothetical protein
MISKRELNTVKLLVYYSVTVDMVLEKEQLDDFYNLFKLGKISKKLELIVYRYIKGLLFSLGYVEGSDEYNYVINNLFLYPEDMR